MDPSQVAMPQEERLEAVEAQPRAVGQGRGWIESLKRREVTLLVVILILSVALAFLRPKSFLTKMNILTTANGFALNAIVTIGMTIALISGGFDLSVGGVLALAAIITGRLNNLHVNVWLAAGIGLLAAMLVGLVNGFLITKVKINPLITTLGTMSITRGATLVIGRGEPQSGFPAQFVAIGQGVILGIPVPIVVMLVLGVISSLLLYFTPFLHQVYYVGGNEEAARVTGIRVERVKRLVYFLSAFLSGLAGILTASRFGVAYPQAGKGLELEAIASAIIGGCSLSGGEGTIYGALLGIALIALIRDGMVLMDVSVYWQDLVLGTILILAVVSDRLTHRGGT
ncbi:MAG: ABC transporter permease [Anaerolineae bacterium]